MIVEKVIMSFTDAFKEDPTPHVVIYNPLVLGSALFSQVMRFGLGTGSRKSSLSGNLNGSRADFTQMIQSYGHEIEIIRAPVV